MTAPPAASENDWVLAAYSRTTNGLAFRGISDETRLVIGGNACAGDNRLC
jgi:hypothetical protein